MEKSLLDLNKLQSLINEEYFKYNHAIMDNKELADVKLIYLRFKELQKKNYSINNRNSRKIRD